MPKKIYIKVIIKKPLILIFMSDKYKARVILENNNINKIIIINIKLKIKPANMVANFSAEIN